MSAPGKLRALAMFTPDRKRFLTRPCRHRQEKKDDYSREGWIQRTKRDEGVLVEDGDNSTNQLFDTEFKARLVHQDKIQTEEIWGSVQVSRHGFWGDVCLGEYTDKEARVACRTMGFKGGRAYGGYNNKYPYGSSWVTKTIYARRPVWISELSCNGTEKSLEDCEIQQWGIPMTAAVKGLV